MRKVNLILAASAALVAGCTTGGALGGGPDEFAVARQQPLVIPPDFALTPPRPGEPQAIGADSRAQALEALFGGPAPRSDAERSLLREAGRDEAVQGARSVVGDPETNVVDKGQVTQTILAVPEGAGQEATVSTPE